jgi:hypothetical protein
MPASQYPSRANCEKFHGIDPIRLLPIITGRWKPVLRLPLVAVQARPAVVAFPEGSTCLRQEITLQTCRLILETWFGSLFMCSPPFFAASVTAIPVSTGMLLLYPLKPLKLYRFLAGDHYGKGKSIRDDR